MHPVLLEGQLIKVHGQNVKIMWDNGSSAALVTQLFAQRVRLMGTMVTYWLDFFGHDKVLQNTTFYTLFMEDNYGTTHEIQACRRDFGGFSFC